MGAIPDDNSWQARLGGYHSKMFTIDWQQQQAICPQGNTSCSWSIAHTPSQRLVVKIKFRQMDCATCSTLTLCTNNREKRRTLTLLAPQSLFEAQQNARERQETIAFKEACHIRAGVESTACNRQSADNGDHQNVGANTILELCCIQVSLLEHIDEMYQAVSFLIFAPSF